MLKRQRITEYPKKLCYFVYFGVTTMWGFSLFSLIQPMALVGERSLEYTLRGILAGVAGIIYVLIGVAYCIGDSELKSQRYRPQMLTSVLFLFICMMLMFGTTAAGMIVTDGWSARTYRSSSDFIVEWLFTAFFASFWPPMILFSMRLPGN